MTVLKIKKIILENFMNYHEKVINFGSVTKISGKNGKGKTSILTGYSWLLFNCDYELRDNPKVRREIDGVPITDMDTAVTAVFDIGGKEVIAKKVQKRTYSKDKTTFKDDNKYFINDVPKTLKDFNGYFGIDMNIFKICSNVNAFLSKKPTEMREFLFSTVDNVTDLDIVSESDNLALLVPLLSQYTREEIEAMNKATKTRITKELPVLDGQIKEKERDCTVVVDVAEMELCKNVLQEQIERAEQSINDNDKLYEEYQKISDEVMQLKLKQSDLQNKANKELEDKKKDLTLKITMQEGAIRDYKNQIFLNNKDIQRAERSIERGQQEIEACREEWRAITDREFDENDLDCPYCKQTLPKDKQEELTRDFANKKADGLESVTKRGNEWKAQINKDKAELEQLNATKAENEKAKEEAEKKLLSLEAEKTDLPENIDITSTEEYLNLQKQIEQKEKAIERVCGRNANEARQQLKDELSDLRKQLSDVEQKIAKADTTEDEKRLEELKQKRLGMEQSKADCEKILDLLEQLDKAKNEKLSNAINSQFGIVDWKLFEFAKNGNYKNCCIPQVDGKSMLDISSNKGNRILGKLDICNSIQKISGLNCPIFTDDMESLDSENMKKALEMMDCQVVALCVTDNEKLKIEEAR